MYFSIASKSVEFIFAKSDITNKYHVTRNRGYPINYGAYEEHGRDL